MIISTFVFMDLESTGLPIYGNRIRITEVSLISVSRESLLNCSSKDCIPRVTNKISFVVNPRTIIPEEVVELTGLSNENLEREPPFDEKKANLMKIFLESCAPPICLIAHNGFKFDFPLLKKELDAFHEIVPPGLLCADSLAAFKHLQGESNDAKLSPIIDQTDMMLFNEVTRIEMSMQEINETTPVAQLIADPCGSNGIEATVTPQPASAPGFEKNIPNLGNVKRKLFADLDRGEHKSKLRVTYTLKHIYESLFNQPITKAHRAESDTTALLQCCVKIGSPLLQYFDNEAKKFEDIIAMR